MARYIIKRCAIAGSAFVIFAVLLSWRHLQTEVLISKKQSHLVTSLGHVFENLPHKYAADETCNSTTSNRNCTTLMRNYGLLDDLSHLDKQFGNHWQWEWIKKDVHKNWMHVVTAARILPGKIPNFENRKILNVIVIAGFFTGTNFAKPHVAFHGGPLGEMKQLSDLISSLHALGYHVTILHDLIQAQARLQSLVTDLRQYREGCQVDQVDMIFTDWHAWRTFPQNLKDKITLKVRLADVYGTEVMYNNPSYARSHNIVRQGFGMNNFCPRQHMTLYPEIPDNSFLGFMVHKYNHTGVSKENIGILYAKSVKFFQGRMKILEVFQKHMTLHCTVEESTAAFPGVVNHRVLSRSDFLEIAAKAKFFIGFGNPREGPGAAEAISRGAIFIQPRDIPPWIIPGKPNNRSYTSQIPYLEHRVGPPHVLTLDYNNLTELDRVLAQALTWEVVPTLPYEFTSLGFLERMHNMTQFTDLCQYSADRGCFIPYPSQDELILKMASVPGQSCTHLCLQAGLDCEYNFFPSLNSVTVFEKQGLPCSRKQTVGDVYAPAYIRSSQTCILQQNPELFSCSSYIQGDYLRLCPCRVYGSW